MSELVPYLGGSSHDYAYGIAYSSAGTGSVTIAGYTASTDFPIQNPLPGGGNYKGGYDAFVARIDEDQGIISQFGYSTYLGGSNADYGRAVAVDASGAAWVVGSTYSTNFLTAGTSYDNSFNGEQDIFVSKILR